MGETSRTRADLEVAEPLLAHLRERLGRSALGYARVPTLLEGGSDALVARFELSHAGPGWGGPLVFRRLRARTPPERARLEAAVQNGLVEQGFPAPAVLLAEADASRLGGAFLVMRVVPGAPLLLGWSLRLRTAKVGIGGWLSALRRGPALARELPTLLASLEQRIHAVDTAPIARRLEELGVPASRISLEGRLGRLVRRLESRWLAHLEPGLAWILEHFPGGQGRIVLNHGDLAPTNVLVEAGEVTGVIDWSKALLAERECGVGFTRAAIATLPTPAPPGLRGALARMREQAADEYLRAYARAHPVSAERVRYYEALRTLSMLAASEKRRHRSVRRLHVLDLAGARSLLARHFARLTGVELLLDAGEPASQGACPDAA